MCLVVLDDLDEWVARHGNNQAEPYMLELQNGNFTLLTTSRSVELVDACMIDYKIDILLEIEGICDPCTFNVKLLKSFFSANEDLDKIVNAFEKFIEKGNLKSMSSSPLLYTIVICTWVTMRMDENSKGLSLCKLCTRVIDSICKKANGVAGCFNMPYIENLKKFSEAACKLLFPYNRETCSALREITLWNCFSLEVFENHSSTGSLYTFGNKSLQYFLTAYHIDCNPDIIDCVISGYVESNPDATYLHVSHVCIFLCGLNILAANKLLVLMDKLSDRPDFNRTTYQETILSGYKEYIASEQEGKCVSLLMSHVNINGNNIRDVHSIWPVIASNVQSLHVAGFKECYISFKESPAAPEQEKSFCEFVLSSCGKLKDVELDGEQREDFNNYKSIWLPLE
ncbi:uncharacterized protein LOC127865905 [Dreissena polymorpha]|nr:uncharacterized protein LOC127865905 [Dreissena polymorpha]